MSLQSFNSFKELLVKKDLSENDSREVRYDILTKIFRFVQKEIVISNIKDFSEDDKKCFQTLLSQDALHNPNAKLTNGEYEALVRNHISGVTDKSKLLIIDLLEKESKNAEKEYKRLEKLAQKFHPKDAAEEKIDLERRIAEIQRDIVDIEMSLMTLENEGQEKSERYKKMADARERRKQLAQRLEKQLQSVKKKVASST